MFNESLATESTFVVAGGIQLQDNILESQPDNTIGHDLSSNPCRKRATTPPMAIVSKKVSNNLPSVMRHVRQDAKKSNQGMMG